MGPRSRSADRDSRRATRVSSDHVSRAAYATSIFLALALGLARQSASAQSSAQSSAPASQESRPVAAAHSAYESADFAGTLAEVARAEAGSLSRVELLDVLELRALAEIATDASEALDRTLTRLLSLEPAWMPSGSAAPRFLAAVEEVRARGVARLEVRATAVDTSDGTRVEARATDPAQLVRGYRIVWRTDHAAPATAAVERVIEGSTALIPTGGPVLVWAEAIGPGGAVIARSVQTRVRGRDHEAAPVVEVTTVAPTSGEPDETLAIVLGVVGGLVLVGGAVTLGVVLGSGNDQTIVMPVVRWSP